MYTHTPGPWEVGGEHDTTRTFIRHELMVEVGGFGPPLIQEANTRLISAAPELLEALGGMLLSYEVLMTESPLGQAAKDCIRCTFLLDPSKAKAAIAKAKGEPK